MHAIALRVSWAASAEKTRNAALVKIKRLCQNVIILLNLSVVGLGPDRVASRSGPLTSINMDDTSPLPPNLQK